MGSHERRCACTRQCPSFFFIRGRHASKYYFSISKDCKQILASDFQCMSLRTQQECDEHVFISGSMDRLGQTVARIPTNTLEQTFGRAFILYLHEYRELANLKRSWHF